jgi:pyruvate/2-oxoglutarate dehydrogenase complex dihydrolipoamide acyltransferase (E2) component
MSIEVKVPVLPESVSDATIASWHKNPGDAVKRDENLVDLETDKVVLEVPAPADGVLKEIRASQGATVGSQDVIAVIEEGAVAQAAPAAAAKKEASAPQKQEAKPATTGLGTRDSQEQHLKICRLLRRAWLPKRRSTSPKFKVRAAVVRLPRKIWSTISALRNRVPSPESRVPALRTRVPPAPAPKSACR